MHTTKEEGVVFAAGAVVCRETKSGREVLLVHRRRYGDWTLPKGKVEPGESFEAAAVREVREETGCIGELAEFLGTIGYTVCEEPKVVLFWLMKISGEGAIADHGEVLETKWMSLPAAIVRLSYERERNLLEQLGAKEGALRPARREWQWWWGGRGYARLSREFAAFRVELDSLEQRSSGAGVVWTGAAEKHLRNVERSLATKDVEGGWYSLHAARRLALFALDAAQIKIRAEVLRQESEKIPPWRGPAIRLILDSRADVSIDQLMQATALRDEYDANQYHKIWLMADQLGVLSWMSLGALVVFLVALWLAQYRLQNLWNVPLCLAVMTIGMLGASFSAAQSLISNSAGSRIPERVANHYVTIIRAFFGSSAGLAGYAFFRSGLFQIGKNEPALGISLAVAFLFGYAGERLIAGIAASLKAGGDK